MLQSSLNFPLHSIISQCIISEFPDTLRQWKGIRFLTFYFWEFRSKIALWECCKHAKLWSTVHGSRTGLLYMLLAHSWKIEFQNESWNGCPASQWNSFLIVFFHVVLQSRHLSKGGVTSANTWTLLLLHVRLYESFDNLSATKLKLSVKCLHGSTCRS